MSAAVYEVFALRYATVERRARDTFLSWREADQPLRLDFFFWAIRGEGRTIVVDTGFSPYSSQKRNRAYLQPPGEGLAAIGIAPAAVSDVILTHLHYDHAGNTGLFPAATFHLQAAEMAFATGPAMTHHLFREHYEVEDIAEVLRLVHQGRVRFHEGTAVIAPGVRVHRMDGHTIGLQAVEVETARGRLLLASDAVHYWANLLDENPFPVVVDVAGELAAYRRLLDLAGDAARIVPSHDPQVLDRFPRHPGSADIACVHLMPAAPPDRFQDLSPWPSPIPNSPSSSPAAACPGRAGPPSRS